MYGKLYAKNFEITLNVGQFDKKVKTESAFFNFIESFSKIDEVSIYPSYHILAQCRVLHFQIFVALKSNL